VSTTTGPGHPDENTGAAVVQTAKDKASEAADVVGGQAAEMAGAAKDQATEVFEEARAEAQQLIGELRDQIREQAHVQGQRLADTIRSLTGELRRMSESGSKDSPATSAVRHLADGGDRIADQLHERGPEGLLDGVKEFARRKPGLFLAGAALAGFAVSRAGKGVSAASHSHSATGAPAEDAKPIEASPPAGQPTATSPAPPPVPPVAPAPVPPAGQQQPGTGR